MMEVAVIGPKSRGTTFVVHAAACPDARRDQRRVVGSRGSALWRLAAASRVAVVEEVYDGQLADDPDVDPSRWLGDFEFKPCCASLPSSAPDDDGQAQPADPKGAGGLRICAVRPCGACGGGGTVYDPAGFGWEELNKLDAGAYEAALRARGRSLADKLPPEEGPCDDCGGSGEEATTLSLAELREALGTGRPASAPDPGGAADA